MFIPLHVKSDYSLGYGTASVEELVEAVAALGYPALALTDIENLYGQVRFHHECRLRGIRPLTGVELRPGFGKRSVGRRAGRIILIAEDGKAVSENGLRAPLPKRAGAASSSSLLQNLQRVALRNQGSRRIRRSRSHHASPSV